jgi:hypothetical protein
MTTTEKNRIIAEFMGRDVSLISLAEFRKLNQRDKHLIKGSFAEDLQYHSSWNWLMEAVEKIESLGYWVNRINGDVWILDNDGEFIVNNTMHQGGKEAVCSACFEFIQWYNQNKN